MKSKEKIKSLEQKLIKFKFKNIKLRLNNANNALSLQADKYEKSIQTLINETNKLRDTVIYSDTYNKAHDLLTDKIDVLQKFVWGLGITTILSLIGLAIRLIK